jgi:hypothetical protein
MWATKPDNDGVASTLARFELTDHFIDHINPTAATHDLGRLMAVLNGFQRTHDFHRTKPQNANYQRKARRIETTSAR